MTKKIPLKHINVDGILYDARSGRKITTNFSEYQPTEILDLRSKSHASKKNLSTSRSSSTKKFVSPRPSYAQPSNIKENTAKNQPVDSKVQNPSEPIQARQSLPEKVVTQPNDRLSYFSFVLVGGILPRGNLALWQASLFRTIASPQTWFLLSLPLLLVQFRVLQNLNLNQLLISSKAAVTPENFQSLKVSVGILLTLFLLGIIVRAIVTSAGIYTRLREIDHRPAKLSTAIHSAMHSLLRQMLNFILHITTVLLWSGLCILLVIFTLTTTNSLVATSKYQILTAAGLIWVFVMVLLYSKHWLQVGLLARSNKVSKVQHESASLLFRAPLKNALTGLFGFLLSLFVIGIIISMSWFVTDYFIRQKGSPVIAILIAIAIVAVVLLTNLQYVLQNLWARQYYFLASSSKRRNQLLYMEREKPATIWPVYVALLLAFALVAGYFLMTSIYASRIRGEMANIHSMIPEEIKLVVPLN